MQRKGVNAMWTTVMRNYLRLRLSPREDSPVYAMPGYLLPLSRLIGRDYSY